MKKILVYILVIFIFATSISGKDNADGGTGGTKKGTANKGYYKTNEYMYKTSLYVGKKDKIDIKSSKIDDFYLLGQVYIKPKSLKLPNSAMFGQNNKIEYLKGRPLKTTFKLPTIIDEDNVPAVPVVNHGNINEVKKFFGNSNTLIGLLDKTASIKGLTKEKMLESLTFTIGDKTGKFTANQLLPSSNKKTNQVPFLVIYEPVSIAYLKDGKSALAFTATEFALMQKSGIVDFTCKEQCITSLTHKNLPNSIRLEESWLGYSSKADKRGARWSNDEIISSGGWGMRYLKAHKGKVPEDTPPQTTPPIQSGYKATYRTNTSVITSVKVKALDNVYPDDRKEYASDTSNSGYRNPNNTRAYVTISVDGNTNTMPIVLPKNSSQYAWIKWETGSRVGERTVTATISGNGNLVFENGGRSTSFKVKIEEIKENLPPDPLPTDRNDNFKIPNKFSELNKDALTWDIYNCVWVADLTQKSRPTGKTDPKTGKEIRETYYQDNGDWSFTYDRYSFEIRLLGADKIIKAGEEVPTSKAHSGNRGINQEIKSGYGVSANMKFKFTTNAPEDAYSRIQNVVAYFPEFEYKTYNRFLEETRRNDWEFKVNKYSPFKKRSHFTPLWYPDNSDYVVYIKAFDAWTPAGMITIHANGGVHIDGNLYDDWHIAPKR